MNQLRASHKLSESVRTTHSQDGAVVLDVKQGQMFNLNLVGSRILELLESGSPEPEIVDIVSREFNAEIGMVRDDIQEFLQTLKAYKLLKASDAEQGSNGGAAC